MLWRCGLAILLCCLSTTAAWGAQPEEEVPAQSEGETQSAETSDEFSFTDPPPGPIVLRDFLVLPAVGHYGRLPLHRDAVEAQLVAGTWSAPAGGDEVPTEAAQPRRWQEATATPEGALDITNLGGGYAFATVESPTAQVLLLEAQGQAAVYVNGQPCAGDPYGLGWLRIPVALREGQNEFLFHLGQVWPRLSAQLVAPEADVSFNPDDTTFPDVIRGENEGVWGAIPVVNASREPLAGARIVCQHNGGSSLATPVPTVPPLSVFKAPFQFPATAQADGDTINFQIKLIRTSDNRGEDDTDAGDSADETLAELPIELALVGPADVHVRTFRSTIDGSVQPYAVQPAQSAQSDSPGENDAAGNGLILALHGAAVTCDQFAAHYSPKSWAHVVAPMGRRVYPLDWEDWGRIDALEALADAQRRYRCDPKRIYVTGHSMGGHGTWHLGVMFPARFAAIAPSAGWASLWSYGGGMPVASDSSPVDEMLARGFSPSDTLSLLGNLRETGVCIVHGTEDTVVPVAQARFMRSRLADFHGNFAYFELPDVGNSWREAPLDDPPLMDFLRAQSMQTDRDVDLIDFTTANPGISHGAHWVSVEAQQEALKLSRVAIRLDAASRTFAAKTINVARLAIDVGRLEPSRPVHVAIDGQSLPEIQWPSDGTRLSFEQHDDRWETREPPSLSDKGPHRYGTFKSVFDNNVVLVYGTQGTAEENEWAQAKARFDATMFWYRANGSLEVVADTEFRADAELDRNVVLYGNAETNAAWPSLLSTCPIQVRRGKVRVGLRPEAGEDLATLFVRPRPGSDRAVVGVVGGTGPVGMRLTTRLRYFIPGVAYPDLLIFGPDVLSEGTDDVRALGYFGLDWELDSGEIVWRDVAL